MEDDMQGPKDEYLHNYVGTKVEARKIFSSPKFEEVVAKYWQLLRNHNQADLAKVTVSKQQYVTLMKRVYKVLLPLYREKEMSVEIDQEWHMDRGGLNELSLHLFTKLLFRVAHQWATHIDLDEYCELLEKIYLRITIRKVIKAIDGSVHYCHPTIHTEIIPDNEGGDDAFAPTVGENDDLNIAEPCPSDEEEKEHYEYSYVEDPLTLTLKKHKKRSAPRLEAPTVDDGDMDNAPILSMKEALVFKEDVVYHLNNGDYKPKSDDLVSYVLAEMVDVLPFGYPTEQFLTFMRQDVYVKLEEAKQARKEALARMKREVLETGGAMRDAHLKKEEDGGLKKATGKIIFEPFSIRTETSQTKVRAKARIVDRLFNAIRAVIKDTHSVALRLHMDAPKAALRSGATKSRAPVGASEPTTEINKTGYNPALQRRIRYKLVPLFSISDKPQYVNINYMYDIPDYASAYRCDVERVENSDKLAIKPSDEYQREEDFLAIETDYKKTRQIMLAKKFETLYTEALNADTNDQKRIFKIVEREEQRKRQVRTPEPLNTKGIGETYDEKSLIKMMKGPFYQMISQSGIKDDDFVTSYTQDLIDYASTPTPKVLLIGKPRSGKSTLAKLLSKKLGLVHVSVENWVTKLMAKIQKYVDEPPEPIVDPETQEEREPKDEDLYTPLECAVKKKLQGGSGPSHEENITILRDEMNSAAARTQGYVLDLVFYKASAPWSKIIRDNHLIGPSDSAGRVAEFSHVIELDCNDEEIKLRASKLYLDPEDGTLLSQWEIKEIMKPLPRVWDAEADPPEWVYPKKNHTDPDNDDPPYIKPYYEDKMAKRAEDSEQFIIDELQHYNSTERQGLDDMIVRLYNHQYLKIDIAGLAPNEILDVAAWRIQPDTSVPLRPVPRKLEGPGDFKACITDPLPMEGEEEPPEGLPDRTWSLWRQTDPVALYNGKVVQGLPEFTVEFANNMFVFETEDNQKLFLEDPKKYLQNAPRMPDQFRMLMLGPRGIGVHTQAQKLHDIYGWKVIDYPNLVKSKLENILKEETHEPNNVIPGSSKIGLSQDEINEIKTGKPFPSWRFIPWVLDHLGYPLMIKPDPPEEVFSEVHSDDDDETKAKKTEYHERKKKEAEAAAKAAKLAAQAKAQRDAKRLELRNQQLDPAEHGYPDTDTEEQVEDCSIDKLVLKQDEKGNVPTVGGFILLGFPHSQIHAEKLKEHGINFDKILYCTDLSEEDAGKEVQQRMVKQDFHYDWAAESERAQAILAVAKEHINEEICKEIDCKGTIENNLIKIRHEIDPFFIRVDNVEDVKTSADLEEEGRRLPKGDFGNFCPVTYVNHGFLIPGSFEPEQEATILGKTYKLAGEKEMEEFKFNPGKYLIGQNGQNELPLRPPPPKIMICGMKGSGVTTQINKLCEKYKLESLELQNEFMKRKDVEKEKRKRRRLLDRGFKDPPPREEDADPSEPYPPPDPEIEDDPEEFEKEAHEKELMQMIMPSERGLIIDGSWRNFPEEAVSAVDGPGFSSLMYDSRRVPELIIILKCNDENAKDRMIDKDAIQKKFDDLMVAFEKKYADQFAADRETKLKEIEEEIRGEINEENPKTDDEVKAEVEAKIKEWDEERKASDEEAKEGDEEKPDFNAMMEAEVEKLTATREADVEFFDAFKEDLEAKKIKFIDTISTDTTADFVFLKIIDKLQESFRMRPDLIERQQASKLTAKELPLYEQSYTYSMSKFGVNSPISPSNPIKVKDYAVLYRERIYYLSDEDEREAFLLEPSKYTKGVESIPLDIHIKPKVCVLGLPKSGKSQVCTQINKHTQAVHVKMDEIIQQFMECDSAQSERLRKMMKVEGRGIDDTLLVALLYKKLQSKECLQYGWVLEDFPKTKNQAIAMAKQGLTPYNVINVRITQEEVYKRTAADQATDFEAFRTILAQKLRYMEKNLIHVTNFYQRAYNSLIEIDGFKSKWYMEDRAMTVIKANIEARQNFSQAYCHRATESGGVERPCQLADLHCDRKLLKEALSQFAYYCPVTWKNTKDLVKGTHDPENCIFYENVFYYFKGEAEKLMFLDNPQRFVNNIIFSSEKGIPLRLKPHKAAEIVAQEKGIHGYCPVTLVESGSANTVVKGDPLLLVQYKLNKFCFADEHKLQKFIKKPGMYNKVELPIKMPPHEDPVSLHTLLTSKKNDNDVDESTTFMEQALGSIVTRGLREVSENRLKYPNLTVKETMLKLFALFLKAENPGNTAYMKEKYVARIRQFVNNCEIAEELSDLAEEKAEKEKKGKWPEFKEKYYNELGAKYDKVVAESLKEKQNGFQSYLK